MPKVVVFNLMIDEISIHSVKISSASKTCDKSDRMNVGFSITWKAFVGSLHS